VKLREFGLLTDENLDPQVITYLRAEGFDVLDVCENQLQGTSDLILLQTALAEQRIVITHDSDFGTLAVLGHQPMIGVVYLRPGHIDPQFTIDTTKALLGRDPDVEPPFILVAKRTGKRVTVRIRKV
jgi:predicted nuclease of predicted toxin-antitoxin system